MSKQLLALIIIMTAVFIGSGIYIILQYLYIPDGKRTIEVVQDNTVIYTFDYPTMEERTIHIVSPDGKSYNDVCLHGGTVCMKDAGCPDLVCVHTGDLKYENLPIVCLPNKLVIRFADKEETE